MLGKVTLPVEIGKLNLFHNFYILGDFNKPLIDQNAVISFPKQTSTLQIGITKRFKIGMTDTILYVLYPI